VDDDLLVRLFCALRVTFPQAELVLSTREPAPLRDRLARLCITQMSAGSSTAPGGYGQAEPASGQQFPVHDRRSPEVVAARLRESGLEPVWEPSGMASG
jgi:2-iminoacetate synthase